MAKRKEYRTIAAIAARLRQIDKVICCCAGCEEGAVDPGEQIQENFRSFSSYPNNGTELGVGGTAYYFILTDTDEVAGLPSIAPGNLEGQIFRVINSADSTENVIITVFAGSGDTIQNLVATTLTVVPGASYELVAYHSPGGQYIWVILSSHIPTP